MKGSCGSCKKWVGILRILLGLGMLAFGLMKLGANTEMQGMVGGAAHGIGLTFLSVTTWFWIATIGEIVAGILLISAHWYKIGALLTIIIMAVAISAVGFDIKATVFAVAALVVLFYGPGGYILCPCCKKGKCCDTACCPMCGKEGNCDCKQQGQQQQQQ